MNLQDWTIRPDIGNDKPNLEISNKVSQEQAEVFSKEPSSEWLDPPIVKAVQDSLSVGLGENVKCVDTNDTQQLQELLANILSALSTLQAENRG
jgi:hypothetical protein